MVNLSRSTFSCRPAVEEGLDDQQIAELIGTIQDELPGYSYRRVTHVLRRRVHHEPDPVTRTPGRRQLP